MTAHRKLVTFDWALKRLLRSKANFKVLEGFLSELLHDDIKIVELLESESNKAGFGDKINRTDLLVRDRLGRRIIIEVQYTREGDYFQRMIYGTAKVLTESLGEGDSYRNIARVVSVNIIHFDLGQGEDYIYEGRTEFVGVHNHDRLGLTDRQRKIFQADAIENIFPEYYILKVNNFDNVARDGLDEWVYFLKHGSIKPGFHGRGLKEAQAAMDVLKLTRAERQAYDAYIKEQRIKIGEAESTILRAERAEAKAAETVARAEAKVAEDVDRAEAKAAESQRRSLQMKSNLEKALHALIATRMLESQAKKLLGMGRK